MNLDEQNDFYLDCLSFNYIHLKKYLRELHKKNIYDINLYLLISLEVGYYESESLKKIVKDFVQMAQNLKCNFDGQEVKFKVNEINFDVGDVLNRHRWIYRYSEKYMLEHNMQDGEEDLIPQDIREDIEKRAYNSGRQQGIDWFKNHLVPALNAILPKNIADGLEITNGKTEIFKGDKGICRLNYICSDYYLNNQYYNQGIEALEEIMNLENSIIDRAYDYEIRCFLNRLNRRGEMPKYPNMFRKYSKKYLVNETIEHQIIQKENNNLEFYIGNIFIHNMVFNGKKIKNFFKIQSIINNKLAEIAQVKQIKIQKKIL